MRTIAVDSYPFEPWFPSPEAAIRHAESYGPLARAKADEKLVQGSQIIDAYWCDTDFVIRFSNGRFLHVFVDPKERRRNVQWSLIEREPELPSAEVRQVGSPAVALQFSTGGQCIMDCSAMIAARRGKDLKKLYVNEFGFYVYTPRQLSLWFGSVYRTDTGDNLLYVFEEP